MKQCFFNLNKFAEELGATLKSPDGKTSQHKELLQSEQAEEVMVPGNIDATASDYVKGKNSRTEKLSSIKKTNEALSLKDIGATGKLQYCIRIPTESYFVTIEKI